jgi:hypothetical protein
MPLMAEFIVEVSNPKRKPPQAAAAARTVAFRVPSTAMAILLVTRLRWNLQRPRLRIDRHDLG